MGDKQISPQKRSEGEGNGKTFQFSQYFTVRHIFTFSTLNYIQSGISFFVSILLAKYLGTEGYGQYAYGLVFANTLMVLMQFGTDKTLVRDLVQIETPEAVLSAAVLLWGSIGLIGTVGIIIWSFFISNLSQLEAWVVLICSLSGAAQGMTVQAWFDFKGKMNLQSVYGIAGRIIFLSGAAVIIFIFDNSQAVLWAAVFLLIGRIISIGLEWNFLKKTTIFFLKKGIPFLKYMIKNNIWVWGAAVGNLFMTQVNQIILKSRAGITELAYYSLAFQIIMVIRLMQKQILRLATPSIAEHTNIDTLDIKEVKNALWRFCMFSFLASAVLLIPLYLMTPWIVENFIGESYLPAVPVMNILYIWSAIYGVALINNQFLMGLRKEKFFFRITLGFGLISLVLSYVFIGWYDATGAALSLLVAHLSSILFQFYIVFRTLKQLSNDKKNSKKNL